MLGRGSARNTEINFTKNGIFRIDPGQAPFAGIRDESFVFGKFDGDAFLDAFGFLSL